MIGPLNSNLFAMPAAYAMPINGFAGAAYPTTMPDPGLFQPAAGAIPEPERFVNSQAGGVILDKDGTPSGRIPAGSFVDAKTGTIYGPDSKQLDVPAGSTVDFFDLPSVADLKTGYTNNLEAFESFSTAGGGPGGKGAPGGKGQPIDWSTPDYDPSFVGGQWGPGGFTAFPSGKGGGGTQVGGVFGGGAAAAMPQGLAGALGAMQPLLQQTMQLLNGLAMPAMGMAVPATASAAGGGSSAVAGAKGLGAVPGDLQTVLAELTATLQQLAMSLSSGIMGGGAMVGQFGQVPHHHGHGRGRPHQDGGGKVDPSTTTGSSSNTNSGTDSSTSTSGTDTTTSANTDSSSGSGSSSSSGSSGDGGTSAAN